MERIDDLLLDHATPSARAHPEALLFIHGMWGGSWLFEGCLAAAAGAGWEAWALNLRGHCGSRPVPDLGRVSLAEYVQDALDALRAIGPAAVIGYSMGGLIAQLVAASRPVRAGVFMVSAAPRGIVVLRWPVLWRMGRYAGAMLGSRAFRLADADADALLLNRMPPAARAAVRARFTEESGRVARELALAPPAVDVSRVTCPTLVVGASADRITPASVQRRIARRYGGDYLEAAAHGHMMLLEDGSEVQVRRVLDWLERAMR